MDPILANFFIIPIALASNVSVFMLNNKNEWFINFIIYITFLYFVVDIIHIFINRKRTDNIYYLHHVTTLIGMYVLHNYLRKYEYVIIYYLLFETSTIFLNLYKINKMHKIYFVITFILYRIIYGSYLLYEVILIASNEVFMVKILLIIPLIIQMLNYYWMYKIIMYICFR